MAVVKVKSDNYPASGGVATAIDPSRQRGKLRSSHFDVSNGATDSSLSSYALVTIPADAILAKSSEMRTDTWGFAVVNIGPSAALSTALANGVARGAATTLLAPQTAANDCIGAPAWQQLGLAAAPADNLLTLYAFASAGATGAGSMKGHIDYYWHQ
jgi:hypothetical protein